MRQKLALIHKTFLSRNRVLDLAINCEFFLLASICAELCLYRTFKFCESRRISSGGSKTQVTGQVRLQVRSQVRSGCRSGHRSGQVTGQVNRKNIFLPRKLTIFSIFPSFIIMLIMIRERKRKMVITVWKIIQISKKFNTYRQHTEGLIV